MDLCESYTSTGYTKLRWIIGDTWETQRVNRDGDNFAASNVTTGLSEIPQTEFIYTIRREGIHMDVSSFKHVCYV